MIRGQLRPCAALLEFKIRDTYLDRYFFFVGAERRFRGGGWCGGGGGERKKAKA